MLDRHGGKRILLVGHAGMMRILLLKALNMPLEAFYRFDPRNATIVRIRVDTGRHGEAYSQLVFDGPAI
jgi:broad specificity phosphatase PhoE